MKSSIIDQESVHRVISLLLEAEAATEEESTSVSSHSAIRVIDAFLVPKYRYDPIKKRFHQYVVLLFFIIYCSLIIYIYKLV